MDDAKAPTTPSPAPSRKRRRFWKVFATLVLLIIGIVAAMPWVLGSPPVRGWLVGRLNAQLAPGSVELESLGVSWTDPVELGGVSLRDPQGKLVLGARRMVLDRGLVGLLTSRPDYGTITIEGATVDVERREDGSIDVLEALASILKVDPVQPPLAGAVADPAPSPSLTSMSVLLKGSTLRVVSPELAGPITAGPLDGSVTIVPGKPIEVSIAPGDEGRALGIRATVAPGPSTLRVDATLTGDLVAVDRLLASRLGSPPRGLGGAWSGRVAVVRSIDGKLDVNGRFDVPEIVAPGLTGPVALVVKGGVSPKLDRLDLVTADLTTGLGRVVVVGSLAEARARQLMDLTATVEPNWATVDQFVAKSVEENARFRATVRPIHIAGSLRADSMTRRLNQIAGEVGLDLTKAEAFGVNLKPTPVVLKLGGGKAVFNPIVTAMNDGPVLIQAHLRLDGANGVWLELDPCRIEKAGINQAVSNSILAYVAPVLSESTQVTGKVTVALNSGSVPITADGSLALDGAIALQDVVCDPGPLGSELNAITGRASAKIKLDQTMIVQVLDGRVRQTGLSIPIGGETMVAIEGSVGFDETLDLKATIPLTARLLGLDPKIARIPAGKVIAVPIGGTFDRPDIDRQAVKAAFREVARSVAGKELEAEANRLLDRIAGPNPTAGGSKTKPPRRKPMSDLERIGRQILEPKKE